MCEADLAGTWWRPASNESKPGGGVVWRTEWPGAEERPLWVRESGDAVDRAREEAFVRLERGQDRRERAGQHRLACPRRTDEQEVVPSGRRDLERALRVLEASDVAQIHVPYRILPRRRDRCGSEPNAPVQVLDRRAERPKRRGIATESRR